VGESYFTWSYSPLLPFSSAPNGVGGVLCTVQETTQKVIGERRILLLRDLAAFGPEAKTADEECRVAAATIARYSKSVPFSLICLIDESRTMAIDVEQHVLVPGCEPAALDRVDLRPDGVADLGPTLPRRLPERGGMLVADDRQIRIVVNLDEVRTPPKNHGKPARQHDVDHCSEFERPPGRCAERRRCPILERNHLPHDRGDQISSNGRSRKCNQSISIGAMPFSIGSESYVTTAEFAPVILVRSQPWMWPAVPGLTIFNTSLAGKRDGDRTP
jgi:hypothetical protein